MHDIIRCYVICNIASFWLCITYPSLYLSIPYHLFFSLRCPSHIRNKYEAPPVCPTFWKLELALIKSLFLIFFPCIFSVKLVDVSSWYFFLIAIINKLMVFILLWLIATLNSFKYILIPSPNHVVSVQSFLKVTLKFWKFCPHVPYSKFSISLISPFLSYPFHLIALH